MAASKLARVLVEAALAAGAVIAKPHDRQRDAKLQKVLSATDAELAPMRECLEYADAAMRAAIPHCPQDLAIALRTRADTVRDLMAQLQIKE